MCAGVSISTHVSMRGVYMLMYMSPLFVWVGVHISTFVSACLPVRTMLPLHVFSGTESVSCFSIYLSMFACKALREARREEQGQRVHIKEERRQLKKKRRLQRQQERAGTNNCRHTYACANSQCID